MARLVRPSSLVFAAVLTAGPAVLSAQPIGTFSWQMTPHCNVLTVTVIQSGGVYTLDGHDGLCGAARRAQIGGVATPNPDGTIGLGFDIVGAVPGESTHVSAVIDLATLSGTWIDSGGATGNFLFNGPGGGVPRSTGELRLSRHGNTQALLDARRSRGTPATQTPIQNADQLFSVEARGYDGAAYGTNADAAIRMMATQNWTPTAHGTRLLFSTTENGSTSLFARVAIDHDGDVGIGTLTPAARLHVLGNIRLTGCVQDANGAALAGTCVSDARFKKEIRGLEPVLDRLAALTPSRYFWRHDEFPEQAFGAGETLGLIAQEVEAVLPELVATTDDGYKAVRYGELPMLALQAIKELKAENDRLRAEIERRLAAIDARLERR